MIEAASVGRSVSRRQVTADMMTGGSASTRNSHCQPSSPSAPLSCSSRPPIGGPMNSESITAEQKMPIMRER